MSEKPLVSVIIPFYQAPTLKNAIESILAQTHPNFELILVNNNSTPETLNIANEYLNDERVSLITEPKQGVTYAMNKGIVFSKGAFIMRMDADDFSFPDRIEKQLEAFNQDPELSVVSGFIQYVGDEKNDGFRSYVKWVNTLISSKQIELNQFVEFPLANPSLMFKREVFEKYGLFEDGNFPEDYEFFLRLMQSGVKMGKVEFPVLKWFDSESRLTRTDSRYSKDSFYRIKARYLANWLKVNNPFYPDIIVWGAGRLSKKRSKYLAGYGVNIKAYIDIIDKKDVIHFESIPVKESCFIVSYVSNRGARDEISAFLISKGYTEGKDFILAA